MSSRVVLGNVPISIPHSCTGERLQRLLAPRVTERGIIIPSMMRVHNPLVTTILVNDDRLVVVKYVVGAGLVKVIFAVGISERVQDRWTPRIWDDLVDDDRFTIRSALGARRASGMGYRDENSAYYTLEALAS